MLASRLGASDARGQSGAIRRRRLRGKVKLERLNWNQFQDRLAENQKIKYTMVDAWSTTCGPCKENFPHVLEMHKKFAEKGLQVISLSLDDPDDEAAVKEAEKFLESKKSTIINILARRRTSATDSRN